MRKFIDRFAPLLGLFLGILVWAFSYFVVHADYGWPRGLWIVAGIVAFLVVAFGPGNLWRDTSKP